VKGVLLLFLLFSLVFLAGCSAPETVKSEIVKPTTVNKGEDFEFKVMIKNSDSKSHKLRSIDVDRSFLDGIYVVETSPVAYEDYDGAVSGQHTFKFNEEIPANSNATVSFVSKAVKEGYFSGDLDVCIDSDTSCIFGSIRMLVK